MSKIPFRTAYEGRERKISPSGSGYANTYEYQINSFGQKVLMKTGETNIYAQIQEQLEESKIENILRRAAIGDMTAFRPDGIYADISEMPTNMIEARQRIQNLENTWLKLDPEIRAKYGNSLDTFIAEAGKEAWLRDMGLLEEIPEVIKEVAEAETPAEVTSE